LPKRRRSATAITDVALTEGTTLKNAILILAFYVCLISSAWSQSELPEGNGKTIVQTKCVQCHDAGRVTRAGYNEKGWLNAINMMQNVGATLSKDQITELTKYLAKNFPERPRPKAVIVPGSAKVVFKEWVVPTPGSRPHDPLAMPDGALWYTGQFAHTLGRLDPKTGQFKEYRLTSKPGPHGLAADKDGNIWYTGNFNGRIGKLNPKTGELTEYHMPNPAARDPHTPIFDQKGVLWFTLQQSNMVGRLDPQTGEVKLATVPTAKSRPYGMVINSKGTPFFVEFGSNKIASIDPTSMTIREYSLPNKASRPRRIAITGDDILWYSDYSRGYLGRFDPASAKASEWRSPGGPKSEPYGIVFSKDAIWYSESGVKPNTIVRFEPKTEKFQSWAIPSGGGVVRNMDVTREGNLALACSGVNGIGLVEIR
jgi:virginiamycin B lyase